jgi:hypothetical protein
VWVISFGEIYKVLTDGLYGGIDIKQQFARFFTVYDFHFPRSLTFAKKKHVCFTRYCTSCRPCLFFYLVSRLPTSTVDKLLFMWSDKYVKNKI